MNDVPGRFGDAARAAVYQVIDLRRDIRAFRPGAVDEDVLARILGAAQKAPSVGFSQPWGFVIVRELATRSQIRESFLRCRQAEASRFSAERREQYLAYRLEGILESALNVCVVADLRSRDEVVLGSTVQPEAVRASVCCAVQNLWLAARAEGLGVGWVSIVEPAVLRQALALPAGVEPVAYLCIGHPVEFRDKPLLEETDWLPRRAEREVIHHERWPDSANAVTQSAQAGIPPQAPVICIPPFNQEAVEAASTHQRTLTKPAGSLGRLEELAAWYAGSHGCFPPPAVQRAALALFAADNGVCIDGVSAYSSALTAAMVANVMSGGAAISCMAKRLGVDVLLVDVGVSGDLTQVPLAPVIPLIRLPVRAGTANIAEAPAMTLADATQALNVGAALARQAASLDTQILAVGEIGIGNTTVAAALVCALTGHPPSAIVGIGTGIDEPARQHKQAIVERALERHGSAREPLPLLASLGGFELAALAGCMLEAARLRLPVVLDGFLSSAAALVAQAFDPNVVPYLLASHVSAEQGAALALAALGKRPVLTLELRLGEGTGALLALDMVRTAVDLQLSMATFETAGIVDRAGAKY
jgi:nicotinate-nucleotide--dimethylbenzimidazole phosphoribosyltransferase